MEITQSLHRALQLTPDRLSTIFGDRTRTFAETYDRVSRLASALQSLGVSEGDRVGLYALNSDRYHEVLLAVPWAGALVNPVNTRWSAREVAFSLVDCQTQVMFVDEAHVAQVATLRSLAPDVRTFIYCGDDDVPPGMLSYEELISDSDAVEDAHRGGSDLFGIFYTGGTTGDPKGVMLSHQACLTSAMGSLVTTQILSRGGVVLHAAPMFHLADIAAWNIGNLTGSTHAMVPSFTAAGVANAIEKYRVTDMLLVPTMIQMLIESPEAATADFSSMLRIMYGASAISEAVLTRARKVLANTKFTQAYGMTELAPITTLLTQEDHENPSLARSSGRAAAHAEIRIVNPDDQEVPRGEVGEVTARGDHVMSGYWNNPGATATALRNGWMHTGDAGYMDDQGYVFLVDRIKDMIITGGENVYSLEVENAILKHPGVAQAAVVGLPDEQWGERVHAFLVLRPGAQLTVETLREFCRDEIASYKLPRSSSVVDAFPLSGAGKVLKRELRRTWIEANRSG